ncbi:MAG: 3-oxo-tetronate kinase [Pseudomonadota bacterium]
MSQLSIGVIADDFTGATDIAGLLKRVGYRVIQIIGVPEDAGPYPPADAVVVALKSRTAPVDDAVSESLAALDWFERRDVRQVIFKYCSTFDSTPAGNIGPVADALLDRTGEEIAVIIPAFPENGRTIYNGHLFVGDVLLENSSMRDHPLTPMRQSDLTALMHAQSRHSTGLVPFRVVEKGPQAVRNAMTGLRDAGHRYAVVDAIRDADLLTIGEALQDARLITGGSGIALGLGRSDARSSEFAESAAATGSSGRDLVLSGSCSERTREQVAHFRKAHPALQLDPLALASEAGAAERALKWIAGQPSDRPVLVYSTEDPAGVRAAQDALGVAAAGKIVEDTLAAIAVGAADAGVGRLIAAGGETSGAIVKALGVNWLEIGTEIAPGVPWTRPGGEAPIQLALKSGNFGGPRFFEEAFETPF